jgi:hypothetical protein
MRREEESRVRKKTISERKNQRKEAKKTKKIRRKQKGRNKTSDECLSIYNLSFHNWE